MGSVDFRFGSMLSKSRKSNSPENLAKLDFGRRDRCKVVYG